MTEMQNFLNSYCYGPVDLVGMKRDSSSMCLMLRDSAGKSARAVYTGCVYWRLDPTDIGIHLSLVRRVGVRELLGRPNSVTMLALRKNADDVSRLLGEWEAAGLSFFLHLGSQPGMEFLVVARELDYQESFSFSSD